ncbi:MAG TPA: DUF3466 family protein [Bacteroidales bacterium]|nr:DUF3466 family protein [Bacteroidales bacterium]
MKSFIKKKPSLLLKFFIFISSFLLLSCQNSAINDSSVTTSKNKVSQQTSLKYKNFRDPLGILSNPQKIDLNKYKVYNSQSDKELKKITNRVSSTGYQIKDLGLLTWGTKNYTSGVAISDKGYVTGIASWHYTPFHAFVWDKHDMKDLGALPATFPSATGNDINDNGLIVGQSYLNYESNCCYFVPVIWNNTNKPKILSIKNANNIFDGGTATGVNNRGQVVGYLRRGYRERAFIWQAKSGIQFVKQFNGYPFQSTFTAINNEGIAVGYYAHGAAFLYNSNTKTYKKLNHFGQKSGCVTAEAIPLDINDKGQITGYTHCIPDHKRWVRAFIYDPATGIHFIKLPNYVSPNAGAVGNAINDKGQVVGYYTDYVNHHAAHRAFVWDARKGFRDLGVLDQNASHYWVNFSQANDINNKGEITGGSYIHGQYHAVIWTVKMGKKAVGKANN